MSSTALIWDDVLATYRFRPEHPMNPRRLHWTVRLIRDLGLAGTGSTPIVAPRTATEEDLLLVHERAYVDVVRELSVPGADPIAGLAWGLGTEDTPVVEGMHAAAARVVGATLTAAQEVISGGARRAFNPAGGLHHARPAEGAGFCVYNDLAVAIRWLQRAHGARVMYLDVDAHHGDGVQQIFYDDPEVLTVSFHESGTYLFPGTGFIDELGEGDGYGYSVNVPLDVHTEDGSFMEAFEALVPRLARAFHPDLIVLQTGCDGHVLDPLSHLRMTTGVYEWIAMRVGEIADAECRGRVLGTGGGGYAAYSVVPRAWTLAWGALAEQEVPAQAPDAWLRAIRLEAGEEVPPALRDPADAFPPSPRRAEVEATNRRTVEAVRRRVLPLLTGWGMAF